ncbi:MAG: alpha/beta hydrolase [Bacteroidota bacterium]|nr:alpha/beta hydrolase [Bacteroidota bacterium]
MCLHNFSSNSRDRFYPLLPVLSKSYTCYLIDLRGHGRSDNPTNDWSKEQFSRDIIAFCRALGLDSALFLAASSGAMTMLRVARYAPSLVKAMVIDSGTYRIPASAQKYYKDPDSLSPKLKEYYKKANEIYGESYWRELAQAFYNFRLPDCDINIPLESLREIVSPTLIVHGDRDIFFPVDIAVDLKMTIPNSELSVFPNTQHIVMEFYPERVAEMATDFFRKQ